MMTARTQGSLAVVLQVIDILESLEVRYHVGGSFASAVHGVPRQTLDADLVVDLDAATVGALVERLRGEFYVDRDVATDAAVRRGSFNAIHFASGFKVDFFVKGSSEFDEIELARSQQTEISADPPRMAYIKTAEDTVLRKLQWYRRGGEVSERQWRDVLGVLAASRGALDRDYLRRWAADLGVGDLLERAVGQVEAI